MSQATVEGREAHRLGHSVTAAAVQGAGSSLPATSFNCPMSLKNCLAEGPTFIQAITIYSRLAPLSGTQQCHIGALSSPWGADTSVRGGPQAYGNLGVRVLSCSATCDRRVRRAYGTLAAVSGGRPGKFLGLFGPCTAHRLLDCIAPALWRADISNFGPRAHRWRNPSTVLMTPPPLGDGIISSRDGRPPWGTLPGTRSSRITYEYA